VEGAGGVGHLVAQQLLAAGERVLDVPPKLAARVRLLQAGDTNKIDPNDARSVAVAALRSPGVREASRDDHATVLKIWSKRYKDLGRTRTQVACRLHQVLRADPRWRRQADHRGPGRAHPGIGHAGRCRGGGPLRARRRVHPGPARHRRGDPRYQEEAGDSGPGGRDQPDRAVRGRPGHRRHGHRRRPRRVRFPGRDHFAAYNGTAPIEVSSGGRKIWRLSRRGNRRLNHAIHMAAVTQIRNRHSQGRAYFEKKLTEGKTRKEALRALKRQISDAIYACLQADARRAAGAKSPGGQRAPASR
jgi:transposase